MSEQNLLTHSVKMYISGTNLELLIHTFINDTKIKIGTYQGYPCHKRMDKSGDMQSERWRVVNSQGRGVEVNGKLTRSEWLASCSVLTTKACRKMSRELSLVGAKKSPKIVESNW